MDAERRPGQRRPVCGLARLRRSVSAFLGRDAPRRAPAHCRPCPTPSRGVADGVGDDHLPHRPHSLCWSLRIAPVLRPDRRGSHQSARLGDRERPALGRRPTGGRPSSERRQPDGAPSAARAKPGGEPGGPSQPQARPGLSARGLPAGAGRPHARLRLCRESDGAGLRHRQNFAAAYPHAPNVFGFCDDATGPAPGSPESVSYAVVGWYAGAAGDPLATAAGRQDRRRRARLAHLAWKTGPSPVAGAQAPARTVCAPASCAGSRSTTTGKVIPPPPAGRLDVVIGRTIPEALAALLAADGLGRTPAGSDGDAEHLMLLFTTRPARSVETTRDRGRRGIARGGPSSDLWRRSLGHPLAGWAGRWRHRTATRWTQP